MTKRLTIDPARLKQVYESSDCPDVRRTLETLFPDTFPKSAYTFSPTSEGIIVRKNDKCIAHIKPRTGGEYEGRGIFVSNDSSQPWRLVTDGQGAWVLLLPGVDP